MTVVLLTTGGVAVLALVLFDVLLTTLRTGAGAGPFTRTLLGLAWRGLLRLHRRDTRSRVLSAGGPGLLMLTVLFWVAGLWAGWTLVFLASDGAVVDSQTGAPAGPGDVVYYVGFTVFTLGVGDYVAASSGWRVLTTVSSFSGLFLVTLSITYLLSVVSAVVARRALASQIHALGTSAGQIVVGGWSGGAFSSAFVQHLVNLAGQLATTGEQHLAYPVLHYFHSREPRSSAPLALARLDDAMLLLEAAVAPAARPARSAIDPVRAALGRYLSAATRTAATPTIGDPPPVPRLQQLVDAGIPLADEASYGRRAVDDGDRRRHLEAFVRSDGWSWPDTER